MRSRRFGSRAAVGAQFVNPFVRDHHVERAREKALEFTSARMAQNYFAVYEELLQEEFARCA